MFRASLHFAARSAAQVSGLNMTLAENEYVLLRPGRALHNSPAVW